MSVLVAVTGGSGSGKSTLANMLLGALQPDAASLISEDWYYRDALSELGVDPATVDFDDISARDHDLLIQHLQCLKDGMAVLAPQYCFIRHGRKALPRAVSPAPVIVVEGAQLLCVPELAALFDLRLYLDAPADVRFIRRLLRDQEERGRTVHAVVHQYLTTVRPAHARLTGPSRARADLVLFDDTGAVASPDPSALQRLVEPALSHRTLAAFRRYPGPAYG